MGTIKRLTELLLDTGCKLIDWGCTACVFNALLLGDSASKASVLLTWEGVCAADIFAAGNVAIGAVALAIGLVLTNFFGAGFLTATAWVFLVVFAVVLPVDFLVAFAVDIFLLAVFTVDFAVGFFAADALVDFVVVWVLTVFLIGALARTGGVAASSTVRIMGAGALYAGAAGALLTAARSIGTATG
jgi:hypothetical protein